MAYNVSYIRQRARQYGLDPNAVIAVGGTEGLHGGVGDHGTSFGPWMLHEGGALPAGKGQAWAESPAGIDYALQRMASVARGLHGQQAIAAIVNRFERPANPGAEIQKAIGLYGGTPAVGGSPGGPLASPVSSTPTASPNARSAFLQSLIAANQQSSGGRTPDYSNLVGSLVAMRSGQASAPASPAAPSGTTAVPQRGAPAVEMVDAISEARKLGLSAAENPYVGTVHHVHVTDSYHYKTLGKVGGRSVGAAVDISGTPKQMAAFYRWAVANFGGTAREIFFDPAGFYVKNGKRIRGAIGGHSDHVHLAL